MDRINGYDLKYVASSSEADMAAVITAIASSAANTVQKEGVSVKIDPHILDVITSQSEEPDSKIDIGAKIEIKGVLVDADLALLKKILVNRESPVIFVLLILK